MKFPPTEEQASIIASASTGANVQVEALAGCAKSTTIEMIVLDQPKPQTIVLAFNKKIKEEMEKRLKGVPNVKVQTANGLGAAALFRAGIRGTLDNDKVFKLAKDVGLRGDDFTDLLSLVRHARLAGIVPKGVAGTGLIPDSEESWEELCGDLDIDPILVVPAREILIKSTKLAFQGTLDFDDQIYIPALCFGSFPLYERIIVDEAQDLSILNHKLISKLNKKAQLIAVGDSHQAIYAFRGADSQSMENIRILRQEWVDQTLSVTFRCPKAVVERQQAFVPHFKAGPNNLLGEVRALGKWKPDPDSAVLCRNNAPAIKLAFRLLRQGIPSHVLGTDIGKNLKRFYNKVSNHGKRSLPQVEERLQEMVAEDPKLADKAESLMALLHGSSSIETGLAALDNKRGVTIATGHRAKGLEWDTVYHLEPQLIPSIFAETPQELQQEKNLRYVIETRTKDKLFFVNLNNLERPQ